MALTKLTDPDLFDFSDLNTALQLPTGDTASRPGSPSTGEWRYNTDEKYVEFWDGSDWRQIDTEGAAIGDPSEHFNVSTYYGTGANQTIDAKFNEAANFNGSSSYIQVPNNGNVFEAVGGFSASVWVNRNTTANQTILNKEGAVSGSYGWSLRFTSAAGYSYDLYETDNTQVTVSTGANSTTGNWEHIVISFNNSDNKLRIYFDGGSAVVSSALGTSPSSNTEDFFIGARTGGSIVTDGKLDQVRIYSAAITDAQANDLYTDETTTTADALDFPVGAGCVAAYTLDGDTSDLSDNYPASAYNVGFTGLKFQPDFVWIKRRDGTENHYLQDSVRGSTQQIYTNNTDGEFNETTAVTSFISNGFEMGVYNGINNSTEDYVVWCWKAGGAPTTDNLAAAGVTPTAGSAKIDGANATTALAGATPIKRFSLNTPGKFSITTFEAPAASSSTIPHGLGVTPSLIIAKRTDTTGNWAVQAPTLGAGYLLLNSTGDYESADSSIWNNTAANATVTTIATGAATFFPTGGEFVVYSFANVDGYQRVDTYTGTADDYGPIIYTTSDGTSSGTDGFEPAFVMIKCTDFGGTTDWVIFDNKRNLGNLRRDFVYANSNAADATAETLSINFYSNGFQPIGSDGTHNASGKNYLYLAIGADPYTTTPSATNSFGLTLNTDPATTDPVGTTFKPENSWIKGYTNSAIALSWGQYDLLRGSGVSLQSDNSGGESDYYYHGGGNLAMLFTDGGYLQPPVTNNNINNTSHDYVSYFWRLGGKQTINNDGTSTSVVTANPASGCSIAILDQPDTTARNFGHGLGGVPEMMILKRLESSDDWNVYHSALGNTARISMNSSNAKVTGTGVWDSTTPTSDVFYLQNQSGGYHVCYFFRSITDVQSVGSYEGNQATGVDNQIDFGFAPRFVLIKNADSAGSQWMLFDSARTNGYALYVNGTGIEQDHTADLTLSSQGLRFGSTNIDVNQSGDTYIYLAIA